MKIQQAKQLYSAQLDMLWNKKRELAKVLEKADAGQNFDRVEISKELDAVTAEYEQTRLVMSGILQKEAMVRDTQAARQQCETMTKAAEDMVKCMEIARRISSGGTVPPADEKKLMEFNYEMYMAAKNMALLHQGEREEYDSLWDEEDAPEETASPEEIAANTEVTPASPSAAGAGGEGGSAAAAEAGAGQ